MGLLYTLCVITPLLAACTVASLRRFWRARGMLPQLGLDGELSGIPCVSKFLPERMRCGARVIYSGVQYVVRDACAFTVGDAPRYFYALRSSEGGVLQNDALSVHIDDGELHVCWWNRGDTRQRTEEPCVGTRVSANDVTILPPEKSDWYSEGFDAEMGWAVLTAITGVGTILSGAKAIVLAVGLF